MTRLSLLLIVTFVSGCSERTDTSPRTRSAPSSPASPTPTGVTGASSQTVEAFIRKLLAEHFETDQSKIEMEQPIARPPLQADDLDLVELVMEIEEQFDITLPDEQLEKAAGGIMDDLPTRITPSHLVTLANDALKRAGKSVDK